MDMIAKELAEQLARKCAVDIVYPPSGIEMAIASFEDFVQRTISERIPLTELIEVARAATAGRCRHDSSYEGERCPLCIALIPLRKRIEL